MTSELKTCPFCGLGPNRVVHNDNTDWWQYECSADGIINTCPVNPVGHIYDTQHEAEAAWNTRAAPDVPELVRYDTPYDFNEKPTAGMVPVELGEYVRYDQAAEMLAAKDAEIGSLKDYAKGLFDDRAFNRERAEEAEAKLAEINEQKPVAYTLIFRKSYGVNAETTFKKFEDAEKYAIRCELPLSSIIPLYAAPVDQTAEIERLRKALRDIADHDLVCLKDPYRTILQAMINSASAALTPTEQQK